jgi:hypothetical protein
MLIVEVYSRPTISKKKVGKLVKTMKKHGCDVVQLRRQIIKCYDFHCLPRLFLILAGHAADGCVHGIREHSKGRLFPASIVS